MNLKIYFLLLITALFPGVFAMTLQEDFNSKKWTVSPLEKGKIECSAGCTCRTSDADNFAITSKKSLSPPHSLQIKRIKSGYIAFRLPKTVSKDKDFSIEFNLFIPDGASPSIHFSDGKNPKPIGKMIIMRGRTFGNNAKNGLTHCGQITAPFGKWLNYRLLFSANERSFRICRVKPDGSIITGTKHPFVNHRNFQELRFFNQPPKGSCYFVDNIVINIDKLPSVANRKNLACKATVTAKGWSKQQLSKLNDGNFNKGLSPKKGTKTFAVDFEFPGNQNINGARLYTKDGKRARVVLRSYNALGHWYLLAQKKLNSDITSLEFKPEERVTRVRLEITPVGSKKLYLKELELYSPAGEPQHELDRKFEKLVDGEFRLGVYDSQYASQHTAKFCLQNHTSKTMKVKLSLTDRFNGRNAAPERKVTIKPGNNYFTFPLEKLTGSEYILTVSDRKSNLAGRSGRIRRLLRYRPAPKLTAKPMTDMNGKKMFFPDDFYLEKMDNLEFKQIQPKRKLVKQGTIDNETFSIDGISIGKTPDNKLLVRFGSINRMWKTKSQRPYYAVASFDNTDNWKVYGGRPNAMRMSTPFKEPLPAAAIPDWRPKPVNGKLHYRFYDPKRDGKVNLRQLKLVWVTPAQPGTLAYQKYDWQVVRPHHTTTWPIWYKPNGEAVILRRTPLVQSFNDGSGFENPDSGSDLGFGQWLSDDGKYLYYGQGRHLARYAPYTAKYDNIHWLQRQVVIWRTSDGFNFERAYLGVPDICNPIASQHYGGCIIRVPGSGGLRVAFLTTYDALHQQMGQELCYSWDGFRWTRRHKQPTFVCNGNKNDWRHGNGLLSTSAVEYEGKIYQLLKWGSSFYHFQGEVLRGATPDIKHVNAEYMKKKFQARGLEKWPYFKKYFGSSWKKLAEHTRNGKNAVGILIYRKNGWFGIAADDKPGNFQTKLIEADGSMTANLKVEENGFAEFTLLDGNGKEIPEFSRRISAGEDGLKLKVFKTLPSRKFKVCAKMKNAVLYTLNFPTNKK